MVSTQRSTPKREEQDSRTRRMIKGRIRRSERAASYATSNSGIGVGRLAVGSHTA